MSASSSPQPPVRLRVTRSAEKALRSGHPWLWAERIREQSREGAPGDVAVVFDHGRDVLAVGLYDPDSPIRVRVLRARGSGPIDRALFGERIDAALARRATLLEDGRTDGLRLVHGESDGMPGLVVDRYAETAVVKLYTAAWRPHLADVVGALLERRPFERVVLRVARSIADAGGDGDVLHGPPCDGPVVFRENGLRLEADPARGQKTGFFLDQRDNRARVGERARGRRVLDVCACSGGFSVSAARGGAREVWSLDRSAPALEAARRNMALNRDDPAVAAARHETLHGDAFEVLARLAAEGRRFDLVVLDPPSFAHRRAQVPDALAAYARLARLGLACLEQDGHVVLASCSRPVTAEAFRAAVEGAASRAGRPLRDVLETEPAADHPADFVEGRYLKCLFARA